MTWEAFDALSSMALVVAVAVLLLDVRLLQKRLRVLEREGSRDPRA